MEDEKDIQTLFELQARAVQTSEASSRVQTQERVRTNHKKRFELTKAEIDSMPDSTVMYRSVGKAYFAAPKPDILGELSNKISDADQDLQTLKQQKEAIEKKMQETENELRELFRSSPTLIKKFQGLRM